MSQRLARTETIKACIFDAYGTLFDVNAAARELSARIGDTWPKLALLWRQKQLEYTWLRTLMGGCYAPFWDITGDALDYAMEASGLDDEGLREDLMALYFRLPCYVEVPSMLRSLKAGGLATGTLSNASPDMLQGAIEHAGLSDLLDPVLSVHGLECFKPAPEVYRLAVTALGLVPGEILFLSSNGWDVAGASHFGFRVVWVNRIGTPRDRLPSGPEAEIEDLSALPELMGLV